MDKKKGFNTEPQGKASNHHEVRELSSEELKEILEQHKKWLASKGKQGEKANLQNADLQGVDLDEADLRIAIINGANLRGASLMTTDFRDAQLMDVDLRDAFLLGAVLDGAYLNDAKLQGAILDEAELQNANLTKTNLQGAYLVHTNLQKANLLGATLREANLQDADLTGVKGLLGGQLAGTNVSGAKLPKPIEKFEGLKNVTEASKNTRKMFLVMLLGCVYSWLTIATTTDSKLLTNSVSSPLPIIGTPIPIADFYLVAPLALFALFYYFHLYLQRLWELLAELPAIFPDGTSLHQKVYPWVLNGLVCIHFPRLRDLRPFLYPLQVFLSIMLCWAIVPFTLLFYWGRYLPRHHEPYTLMHVTLVVISGASAIFLYRLAASTLRGKKRQLFPQKRAFKDSRTYKCGAVILGIVCIGIIFYLFSLAAINGIPPNAMTLYYFEEIPKVERWVPHVFSFIGIRTYADFYEADVSEKPERWIGKLEEELLMVKGARLPRRNVRYVYAVRSFLVNANLHEANLWGANLQDASLQGANLQEANLQWAILFGANLKRADLQRADFQEANLKHANLEEANLFSAHLWYADLEEANLKGANLEFASLRGAYLKATILQDANLENANLKHANLEEANLKGANLKYADLRATIFLTIEQLSEVSTLYRAELNPSLKLIIEEKFPHLLEEPLK